MIITDAIAIIGAACRYPDANDPAQLFETALARRRAFRPIPAARLSPVDYLGAGPDSTYVKSAAVLEGWEFDRSRYRVPGKTHRVTDVTHWLALEVAGEALASAGYPDGRGLATDQAGVMLGNTLTGEFSRASLLRLRWPYVRRVVAGALASDGREQGEVDRLLADIESSYKAPFPEPNDESLAGGMANTIAGRICNHFDLHGGGYVVDGACSSSLLAVIAACRALTLGELDLALAGGVDLSLDPFELVGFARTGALAEAGMRVYDAHPTGFLPGEGCGMVTLVRADDAKAAGLEPLALIRGWGMSSDGRGGITRPEAAGQRQALDRAYRMAGFGPESVMLFEGHGTGTAAGDQAELQALISVNSGDRDRPAALGSVKANIGHTKAAAGLAGLLKATMAVSHRLIPPTTGCDEPHELLREPGAPLRIATRPEPWPAGPVRAGVSAMGFGGINTHVVLESAASGDGRARPPRRRGLATAENQSAAARPPSHEVFAFGAATMEELAALLERAAARARSMSLAEHGDLAASLAGGSARLDRDCYRVGLVAAEPAQLSHRAAQALRLLPRLAEAGQGSLVTGPGLVAGRGQAGRVGLLFTGQGAPLAAGAGALGDVCPPAARRLWPTGHSGANDGEGGFDTSVAQPAIFSASMAGLAWLESLGVEAHAAAGHSLGEISALCWAQALTRADALSLTEFRGSAMRDVGEPGTGMVSVTASADIVAGLIDGTDLAISADNGTTQVVGGPLASCARLATEARRRGLHATQLKVSHAFHTRAVAAAAPLLADYLADLAIASPARPVYSTITGGLLGPEDDLRTLLVAQVTKPVLFRQAVHALAADSDLLVEVGPGRALASLAAGITPVPAIALDVGAESAESLAQVGAAVFAAGAARDLRPLFATRFQRPFDLWREPVFLANACELAPPATANVANVASGAGAASRIGVLSGVNGDGAVDVGGGVGEASGSSPADGVGGGQPGDADPGADVGQVVLRLVAGELELPADAIERSDRLLSDLHLGSLSVMRLAAQAAVACARAVPATPPPLGDLTIGELTEAVEALPGADAQDAGALSTPGVAPWHRVFAEVALPVRLRLDQATPPRRWHTLGAGPLRQAVEHRLDRTDAARAATAPAATALAVFLPANPAGADLTELVEATKMALADGTPLVIVDEGECAAGFVGVIRLEHPDQPIRYIRLAHQDAAANGARPASRPAPAPAEALAETVTAALAATEPDVIIGQDGQPGVPSYRPVNCRLDPKDPGEVPLDPEDPGELPLDADDVVLVTGGGKGIGFESALALGRSTRAGLALLGRSNPAGDPDLAANLARLEDEGIRFGYASADVAAEDQVRRAVRELTGQLGPVTAILHCSGVNEPARFADLSQADFARHAAPKARGLRAVLGALDTSRLRILVTYGSVIGRFGLPGEAHYALANGQLRELARTLARELPQCWVCDLDWTAWAGAGMGERLEVVDTLVRAGVSPIGVDEGVELLLRLLATRPGERSVVIAGRLPGLDQAPVAGPPRRFTERVITHTAGVELIAETTLSRATDAYLADHVIDGLYVLPAVVGLEAMSEAASALTGRPVRSITCASFDRPVIIPAEGVRTVRVCALIRADGAVDVVVRSDETEFAADHFTGRVEAREAREARPQPPEPPPIAARSSSLPAHEGKDLYGPLFFHGPWFRRLQHYRDLTATTATAVLSATGAHPAPTGQDAELGDAALNDASIHVLQACVPHRRLLPIGCARFSVHVRDARANDTLILAAQERWREGTEYCYDIVVRDTAGRPVVSWHALRLRELAGPTGIDRWPAVLLGPYLQRSVAALLPGADLQVRVSQADASTDVSTDANTEPGAAADGSRLGGLTLAAWSQSRSGCHWQLVREPADHGELRWTDTVGTLARLTGEPERLSQARLRAAGAASAASTASTVNATSAGPERAGDDAGRASVTVSGVYEHGWVVLRAGSCSVASVVAEVDGLPDPVTIAIAVEDSQ